MFSLSAGTILQLNNHIPTLAFHCLAALDHYYRVAGNYRVLCSGVFMEDDRAFESDQLAIGKILSSVLGSPFCNCSTRVAK